jgi:hypothetical protein
MARKLVKLSIKETSGVDHPAHLHDGWVVMKSATPADAEAVLDELRPTEISNEEASVEVAPELPAEVIANEVEVDTAKAANAVLETLEVFKEKTMSEVSEMTNVVIVPEAASEADILKAMPTAIRKMLDDASANAEAALRKAAASEAALIAEREARADEAAVIKAAGWSHLNIDPTVVGPALRRLAESDTVLAGEVVKALDSANALIETNVVFTEVGSDAPVTTDNAFSKMENLAKAAVAAGTAPSFEAALMAVAQSNPDLYTSYLNEKGR